MESTRLPFLCFEDFYAEYRPLGLDYWNGTAIEGRFKWAASVEEVCERRGVPKKDVIKLVRLAVTAVNLDVRCADCGYPQELSSRSSFTARVYGNYLCTSCLQARNRTLIEKRNWKRSKNQLPNEASSPTCVSGTRRSATMTSVISMRL
jgi:hypothetical protein